MVRNKALVAKKANNVFIFLSSDGCFYFGLLTTMEEKVEMIFLN